MDMHTLSGIVEETSVRLLASLDDMYDPTDTDEEIEAQLLAIALGV